MVDKDNCPAGLHRPTSMDGFYLLCDERVGTDKERRVLIRKKYCPSCGGILRDDNGMPIYEEAT